MGMRPLSHTNTRATLRTLSSVQQVYSDSSGLAESKTSIFQNHICAHTHYNKLNFILPLSWIKDSSSVLFSLFSLIEACMWTLIKAQREINLLMHSGKVWEENNASIAVAREKTTACIHNQWEFNLTRHTHPKITYDSATPSKYDIISLLLPVLICTNSSSKKWTLCMRMYNMQPHVNKSQIAQNRVFFQLQM